jgi:hypothetical protein
VPNSATYLTQTPILKWFVVWCGSQNMYQKNMLLKETRLYAQNMMTIMGSMGSMIGGGVYDQLMSTRILTMIMNEMYILRAERGLSHTSVTTIIQHKNLTLHRLAVFSYQIALTTLL